jgi:hypothetical protein
LGPHHYCGRLVAASSRFAREEVRRMGFFDQQQSTAA